MLPARKWSNPVRRLSWLVGMVTVCVGCSSDLFVDIQPPFEDGPVAADEVLIRFRNFSFTEAVNVEFFATSETLELVPDDLFVEANIVSANIGVAGSGLLEPRGSDSIVFPCTADLVVGTTGGVFKDNDTGEIRGTGDMHWVQANAIGLCGRTVTFEFAPVSDGFVSRLSVGQ